MKYFHRNRNKKIGLAGLISLTFDHFSVFFLLLLANEPKIGRFGPKIGHFGPKVSHLLTLNESIPYLNNFISTGAWKFGLVT